MSIKPLYILIKLDVDGEIVTKDNVETYVNNHCNSFEYKWEDYCKETAEDCGYLQRYNDTFNPLESCIDWKEWSDLMAMDYDQVEFEGKTYYWREA